MRAHPRGSLGPCVSLLALLLSTTVSMADPTVVTTIDCAAGEFDVINVGSSSPVSAEVTLVLATYPSVDGDCPSATGAVVQVADRQEFNLAQNTARTIAFGDYGVSVPANCDVYIATVRARFGGSDWAVASCEVPVFFPITILNGATLQSTVEADLAVANEIDLAAIDGGTCIGASEYVVQACSAASSDSYRVTMDAKFLCANESECPPTATPGGPSSVLAVHSSNVAPGKCGRIGYLNDQQGEALTRCCDQLNVPANMRHARQCAKFIVTQTTTDLGAIKAVSPAVILDTPPDNDGGGSTSCTFVPEDTSSVTAISCKVTNCSDVDVDEDGVVDTSDNCGCVSNAAQTNSDGDALGNACDNCPQTNSSNQTDTDTDTLGDVCDNCPTVPNSGQLDWNSDSIGDACDFDGDGDADSADNCLTVYNPTQADQDGDGIGNACDGQQNCHLCPAPTGTCDNLPLGSACGSQQCGGVCRYCNGNISCYKKP